MQCRERVADCSENHAKRNNKGRREKSEYLRVKPGGIYSNHWVNFFPATHHLFHSFSNP